MHLSSSTRHARIASFMFVALLVGLGCSGTGSGCAGLTPYAAGTRYMGPKNDNAVNIRLSPQGINYLNTNWQTLVELFAPGRLLQVPVACIEQNVSVIGDVLIADQGKGNCNGESCGRMDGQCVTNVNANNYDTPAQIQVQLTGFSLTPRSPDTLDATVQLAIDTGNLYVDTRSRNHVACVGLSAAKCAISFDSARGSHQANRLVASVKFSIDMRFDKLLSFEVSSFSGTQICGASGAPAEPQCVSPGDLEFDGQNNCGDVYCGVADWDPIKNFVLGLLSAPLQSQITAAVAGQSCAACQTAADCAPRTDGNSAAVTCDDNVCMSGGKCAPRFLGVEGKFNLASVLGSFGAPADAELALSLAAGATAEVNSGMNFGTRVGIQPSTVSSCVPAQAAPPMTSVNFPDFDAEATAGSGYHVGLGISSNFLNNTFWAAHQAGALCLNLSTENVGLINSGLFSTFLPSLGKLVTRDGKDAPMMVVLRPARAPTVVVGEGTYDPVTKKPIKPLLLLTLADVSVDFYALIDDRQARLFTLTADISLPLSLIFEGCDSVTPALGDVRMLIGNIRTANSEILAEDPQVLADLVPAVIGLAEPALASGLSGFSLPALGNFKLKVNETKGIGRISGSEAFNHLGIYATLKGANEACAIAAPQLAVSMKRVVMPAAADMKLTGRQELPWPQAVLDVRTIGKEGSAEYSFKIDNGLWTDFTPATNNELVVTHSRFLLQGQHTISVRTRVAEDPRGISSPRVIPFLVDWDAPRLTLIADVATDRINVVSRDAVSQDKLEFAYQVGEGAQSAFGAEREIKLSAVEPHGGVTVFARDEYGNVGQATWKAPVVALRPDSVEAIDDPSGALPQGGCSTAGGFGFGLIALVGLLRHRKK
ncbi:MAG: hypothetical protein ACO1OB_34695 [Archangium sp.]